MEEALRASAAASRRDLSSMSMRQLADSIPVRDEEDRKPSTKLGRSTYDTSSSAGLETVPIHTSKASGGPVTMSLPAILRQNVPGYKARSARMSQLQPSARASTSDKQESSHEKARQKLSRRKLRRWENAHFHGSTHIIPPRPSDYSPVQLSSAPIFPSPPPSTFFPYKPSDDPTADPNARAAPAFDDSITSADHGRFSLPMKGLKRNTRRIVAEGGIGGEIVEAVDYELRAWLEGTEVWLSPETIAYNNAHNLNSGKRCICEVETDHGRMQAINQLAKQPHSLVWQSEDSFTRFLIHAIARYYRIVSFTKTDPTTSSHLIWLLRPSMAPSTNMNLASKPKSGFETPPTTASEWEASSIGALTTSASELESIASSSGVDMLSADEEVSAEENEDEDDQQANHEGDETIVELEVDDAILLSRANAQPSPASLAQRKRQQQRGRPSLGRALSDIDSGAEVDDEREEDDGMDTLQDSIADLTIGSASRTARRHPSSTVPRENCRSRGEESLSRSPSPARRRSLPQARKVKAGRGWRMPERTFADWVLAS